MPFFDDSGPKPEEERNIFWRSTALVGDQLEKMVFLNLIWSAQTLPAVIAWAIPALSAGLKLAMVMFTAVMLIPMTGFLFAMLDETSQGTPLDLDLARMCFRRVWLRSFIVLLPLFSLFYWLWLAATMAGSTNLVLVDAAARLGILILAVLSIYWGALFAADTGLGPIGVLKKSVILFWQRPGATLVSSFLCLLALLIGIISIGGFYLIMPVLIVLIQVQHYRNMIENS